MITKDVLYDYNVLVDEFNEKLEKINKHYSTKADVRVYDALHWDSEEVKHYAMGHRLKLDAVKIDLE